MTPRTTPPPFLNATAVLLALLLGSCDSAPPSVGSGTALRAERSEVPASKVAIPAPALKKIDVHLHVAIESADLALAILDEQGIAIGLNASGGAPGYGLDASAAVAIRSRGRLLPLCNLQFARLDDPSWPDYVAAALHECKRLGGKGLKIAKNVGLGLFSRRDGRLIPVDDPSLDVVFETAGRLGLPVLIHSGDPKVFFDPLAPENERFDELHAHPSWSFHGVAPNGQPWPSWQEILDQFERRVARHPQTTFVGAHFGNAAEDPDRVARMLERFPNYVIDTAARVPEFGRHPADRMRRFFERFQDRILFGSDLGVSPDGLTLGSSGIEPGTRAQVPEFFARHWAYFETAGLRMPHPTPIQGNWTIDGIGLPRSVLEKVYATNAERVFGLAPLPNELESQKKPGR